MSSRPREQAVPSPADPPCIGRREFIERSLGSVIAASALGGCASLITRTVTPIDGALRLALVHFPELTMEGGALKVVPKGASDPVYVLALGNRRFAALSPICTHLGCTVDIEQARLVCPCHGSSYDREGRVLRGPAEYPLARYPVEVTADDVLVIALAAREDGNR